MGKAKDNPRPASAPPIGGTAERVQVLASYAPGALEGDADLSAIAEFAAHLCQAEVAAVTLVGEASERFLVNHGAPTREIERDEAFCPHAVMGVDTMVVPDASRDPRFAHFANVAGPPQVRFYAGQPLISEEGVAIGTLSVLSVEARPEGLTDLQLEGFKVLADACAMRIRAHRKKLLIEREAQARDLLARELSHRIKNIFAVVAGLVSLTVRKHPESRGYADELSGMIRALGRAHDFVRPVDGVSGDNLRGLLKELFAPYGNRIRISGSDFTLTSRAATPVALVFHELATNAAKYGALASEGGTVDLAVRERKNDLVLLWRERGGKPPKKKQAEGFGSRLVEMSVTGQLGGKWERRFEPEGLVIELTLSKEALAT